MKRSFLYFSAALFVYSCNVRKTDKVADEAGIRQEKLEKEAEIKRRNFETDSVKKVEGLLKDSTAVVILDSVYNFGTVKEGTKVEHSFAFKNTGDKPLLITEAHASCGCTVPEKPNRPIMPGETEHIKVVFNTQGKTGHQEKTVLVNSNAKPAFTNLKIFGEVQ